MKSQPERKIWSLRRLNLGTFRRVTDLHGPLRSNEFHLDSSQHLTVALIL